MSLPAKYVPHFKPGKELRERVDGRGKAVKSRVASEPMDETEKAG